MFTRTRWLRRRRTFVGLALGFATFIAAGSASGAPNRILEPRLEWLQSRQQQPLEPRLEFLQSQQRLYDHTRYGASHQVRPSDPSPQLSVNSGIVSKSLMEQHMLNEARDVRVAAGVTNPNYSHLPSEDRAAMVAPATPTVHTVTTGASSSSTGFASGDWMRGIALAVALIAASAFATLMVRGGPRTAHS
jgi:hypothetical protein